MQLSTTISSECRISLTFGPLSDSFTSSHRTDLGSSERLKIGLIALFGNRHGRIRRLSVRYSLSRTSIYHYKCAVAAALNGAFSAPLSSPPLTDSERESAIVQLLVTRFVGGCSISATSAVLKHSFPRYNSVGFVSEILRHIGSQVSPLIAYRGTCCWACDEIYYCGKLAILVTVEPLSHAILHISLALSGQLKAAWLAHWQRLNEAGIDCQTLVSDEGVSLRAAREDYLSDPTRATALGAAPDFQPDTFHGLSHRLGVFYRRFEKAALTAIEAEYERQSRCHAEQTPHKLEKFKKQWAHNKAQAQKAIQIFDNFSFLYRHLLAQLAVFDKNGLPRVRAVAEQEAQCALELMKNLDSPALNKELDSCLKILPQLFAFLDKAQAVYQHIIQQGLIEDHKLPFITKAWQYLKTANKVKNNYPLQTKIRQKAQDWLEWLAQNSSDTRQIEQNIHQIIFRQLETIIQASSSVESVNAFLRTLLNQSRDQIDQNTLNLFMDYYNHRPFKKGKRKGLKPIEILTQQKNDSDWIEKTRALAQNKR